MKKYKVGSLVYTAKDEHSDFTNEPLFGPGIRVICWSAMNALIKDGIATEVRKPIVSKRVVSFAPQGFVIGGFARSCDLLGLNLNTARGRTFEVVATEIIEQEDD